MNTSLVTHLAALILGLAVAWGVQGDRAAARVSKLESAHAQALATGAALNTRLQEAQNAATLRGTNLRRDAAAATAAGGGLRSELAAMRASFAQLSAAAIAQRAAALADVLNECVDAYRDVAEKADRHASDALKLHEAWPAR